MFSCSKIYTDLPFAHRQHNHKGHCSLIHGHNWSFEFTFAAKERDVNGFVIDFGNLKWLKAWLAYIFDHTLVLNEDDPMLEYLRDNLLKDESSKRCALADIRVVPNAGAEGLAHWVFDQINIELEKRTNGRVFLLSVKVKEDEKNSATFAPIVHVCSND